MPVAGCESSEGDGTKTPSLALVFALVLSADLTSADVPDEKMDEEGEIFG